MNVVNKLTEPGGIRRVELLRDIVVIKLYNHEEIVYQRIKGVKNAEVQGSTVTA